MEELLKIAKEKYPVGTTFVSVFSGDHYKIETHNSYKIDDENDIAIGGKFVYSKGVWAQIISKPEVKEETMTLLEEAKRRFPVGTKFVPAHFLDKNDDYYCIIVEEGEFVEREKGTIFQTINGKVWDERNDPKCGNTWWNRALYYQGNWARVIEEPKTRIVESLNECKAEDPLTNISSVTDPYADFVPGTTQTVRTFGQIKDDNFFKTATESLCKMLEAKNKAYGESALKPLDIFAKHHPYGARLDEKLARIKNSEELRKNDVADIIGGLFLICKDKGWSDFTDLID